jgi:hypothetical protein
MFPAPEDQPRLHNTARREDFSLAVYAVYAVLPWLGKGKMSDELDAIDFKLLGRCQANPCQPLAAYVRPLIGARKDGKRAERTLYERLENLENLGFIHVDRSKKSIALATITGKGKDAIKDAIKGRGKLASSSEDDLHE